MEQGRHHLGVTSVGGVRRYPFDDIITPTTCPLLIPYNKRSRKEELAQGIAFPPESGAMYNKPIPPDYALVDVSWTRNDFEDEETDIPSELGERDIRAILGAIVLWNKEDIILELMMPRSHSPWCPRRLPQMMTEGNCDT